MDHDVTTTEDAALTLPVVEEFGPTIQGEGPSTGRAARFIRLGHCNLSCSWCDTPYSWDAARYDLAAEMTDRRVDQLVTDTVRIGAGLTIITGGEPLMHQRKAAFLALLSRLQDLREDVEVETNGTIPPTDHVVRRVTRFNVSPKLPSSGMDPARALRPAALRPLTALSRIDRASFKFVVVDRADLAEVRRLVDEYAIPGRAVWIMPEGTTPDVLLDRARALVDDVVAEGWNLTPRLHALLWPNERSR